MLIHRTIDEKRLDQLKTILKRDEKQLNTIDLNGETALHIAIYSIIDDIPVEKKEPLLPEVSILFYLLDFANLNVDIKNKQGQTALVLAVKLNYPNLFNRLITISKKELCFHKDKDDNTLLHWAVYNNSLEMVQKIYNLNPKILHQNNRNGLTPLHSVGMYEELVYEEEYYEEIIRYFLIQSDITIELPAQALPYFFKGTGYQILPNISSTVLMVLNYYKKNNLSLNAFHLHDYLTALFHTIHHLNAQDLYTSVIIFGETVTEAFFTTRYVQIDRIYRIIAYIYCYFSHVLLSCDLFETLKDELIPFIEDLILQDIESQKIYKRFHFDKIIGIADTSKDLAVWTWRNLSTLQKNYMHNLVNVFYIAHPQWSNLPTELKLQIFEPIILDIMKVSEKQLILPCTPGIQTKAFYCLIHGLISLQFSLKDTVTLNASKNRISIPQIRG